MTDTSARLGQGSVTLKLGNEELELKPSIHAIKQVCSRHGGVLEAINKVSRLDFNTMIDIIFLGIPRSYNTPKERARLEEKIYMAGLSDDTGSIAEAVMNYLKMLIRGGRPDAPRANDEIDEDSEGN